MAQYVTKIRTENGDLQIDYLSLANLPTSDATLTKLGEFADAKAVGDKIKNINDDIQEINNEIKSSTQGIGATLSAHIVKVVTTTEDGHMLAADKTKLDGIEKNANNYSLPTASGSTLGGVKTTSQITSADGLTACPIIDGVPYCKNIDTSATTQELNMLSGLSTVSEKPRMEVITLLASAWVENELTVAAANVTEDNLVMISPEPSNENYNAYAESNIRCIAQSNGTLTFNREYESDTNILVNVVVFI